MRPTIHPDAPLNPEPPRRVAAAQTPGGAKSECYNPTPTRPRWGQIKAVGGAISECYSHLVEVSRRPNVTIQVVPYSAGGHTGLLGAFVIADLDGSLSIVYVEDITDGRVFEDPATVSRVTLHYKSLQCEALPKGVSRELNTREWLRNDGQEPRRSLAQVKLFGNNGGNCVEVGAAAQLIAVRDSKDPHGPRLAFGRGHGKPSRRGLGLPRTSR